MESRARCHEHIAPGGIGRSGMDRVADLDVDRIESHRFTPAVAAITSFMGDHQIKCIGDRSTGGDGDARAFRHIDVGGAACGQMPVAGQRAAAGQIRLSHRVAVHRRTVEGGEIAISMDGLAQDAAVGVVERNGVFTIERSHVRQYELQGF